MTAQQLAEAYLDALGYDTANVRPVFEQETGRLSWREDPRTGR